MPSILTAYDKVGYIAAKNFIYNGKVYKVGDDVPEADGFGNLESMVRSRRLIPVIDSPNDAPLQFRRTVMTRELALRKLGLGEPRAKDPNRQVQLDQEQGEQIAQPQAQQVTQDDFEYDPSAHTMSDVLTYAQAHPDQVDQIRAKEEQGKARPRLLSRLGGNEQQTEDSEDEDV